MRLNLHGISYVESTIAVGFIAVMLVGLGRLTDPEPAVSTNGPDYTEALSLAQAEIEVLATLAPEEVGRQMPLGERVTVIGGSLLPERDRRGAVSIRGRKVSWRATCDGLRGQPGDACPGIYRRIERLDPAESPEAGYQVTVVIAWPDDSSKRLRRIDLQARVG